MRGKSKALPWSKVQAVGDSSNTLSLPSGIAANCSPVLRGLLERRLLWLASLLFCPSQTPWGRWQVSFQLVWLLLTPGFKSQLSLSNLHLPLAHFFPLCLMSAASPEPLDSPDPSFLACSGCTLCCLCLILFPMFCSQRGVWEGMRCWEQCPEAGGQEKQNQLMDQRLTTDHALLRLPCPLSPPVFHEAALLLNKQRAQPISRVSDQRLRWGPSLSFCSGVPRLSHPCHQLKDDDDKDLCVPIAWRTGLGWPIF